MAKFRQNHTRSAKGWSTSGMMTKVGLFALIIAGLFWAFSQFTGEGASWEDAVGKAGEVLNDQVDQDYDSGPGAPGIPKISDRILPTSTTGQVIKHNYYALSYSEEHEQAEWVAYELTRKSIQAPNFPRPDNFRPDPKVRKASASKGDYRGSGYDRGHLVPAGDMSFDERAISETFYMSNMSPQIRNFNGGVWRELEENVRDWAYKFRHLYIVSGPVLTEGIRETIGLNEVAVPDKYYKVILDLSEPEIKAIAFLIPNELSNMHLSRYMTTIDEVEEITGIDFFPDLLRDERLEGELESSFDPDAWPFHESKYQTRLNNWNKRKLN